MSLDLLVPTWLDLAGWAGVLFAALALAGLGRIISGGRARPEAALVAGWGVAALVLTFWGVATPVSLRLPAIVIAVAGIAAQLAPRLRLTRREWLSVLRIAVLALPLFLVLASARPAEPDTFLNLLPNAAYLYDHASFPAAGRAPAHSYLATAPYTLQFAAFLAGLVTPGFPANALIAFNLVLQLAAGLLLARLASRGGDDTDDAPSWGACALGLLLATALNPGFVPRYHLSGYGEPSVTVTLAFAAWFASRALRQIEAARGAAVPLILLAFALAALVNIKQDSVALALALVVTAAALGLTGAAPGRALASLALAALPAAVLYLAWRWYVLSHLPQGELALLPAARWQLGAVGEIVLNMLRTMAQKGFFYAVLLAAIGASFWHGRRAGPDLAARMGLLLAGSFVLYSAALVFAYVALFPGTMGSDAHSYFRYSTHLSLLLMAALVLLLRDRVAPAVLRARFAPALAIALILACPVAFLRYLRFDLEPPALRVWRLAAQAAPLLPEGARVALVLPGDNGSVAAMLETVLRTTPPRRPALDLTTVAEIAPDTLDRLAAEGYRFAIVSCAPAGLAPVPPGSAAILAHDDLGWHASSVFTYPPVTRARWSHVLSDAPLCLG
jgi:hypothetical protein